HLRSSRAGDSVGGETRAIGKGVPGTHSGAGGPPTRGREGPSRRRPMARDLRGDRFQFPGIWPRISKIYFFFRVPRSATPMRRFLPSAHIPFSALRLYGLCADVALTAPIHRCYSEESHTEGRRPCPPSRSSCSTA